MLVSAHSACLVSVTSDQPLDGSFTCLGSDQWRMKESEAGDAQPFIEKEV